MFSIISDEGEQIIPIFECEDDVERYNLQMDEYTKHPKLQIVEVDGEVIVTACESRQQKYAIIGVDDFLVPPKDLED